MMKNLWLLLLVSLLTLGGCGEPTKKKSNASKPFTLPEVPVMLSSAEERAAYIVAHYWDNFDFADTTLIRKAEITEQAFADYLNLFPHTPMKVVENSIDTMLNRAITGDQAMFDHFATLYEKYLYEPNSPFRDENYYIAALKSIIANDRVDELHKTRPRYQLEKSLKNRVGDMAADVELVLKNGRTMKLSQVSAAYTILFFNNPDCHDCARVKEVLSELSKPSVKIVAIYPDEEIELWQKAQYPALWINGRAADRSKVEEQYDLRAIPTLYLLDKEKRVVLKDAPAEAIIEWLSTQK